MLSRTPTQTAAPQSTAGGAATTINSMKFINENKHFIAATATGFQVCETASGVTKINSAISGGTALCDSYKNSNIFFFVGTGTHIEFPSTRLCLWNDKSKQVVGSV